MLFRRAVNKVKGHRQERLRDVFWAFVALLVIVAGALGYGLLGALRVPIEAVPVVRAVPLVETAALQWHDGPVPVSGRGFIRPARLVELSAETSGRVVSLHAAVQSRGRVREGEVIARLDDRAAKAALERASSDIGTTRARQNLNRTQLERARTLRERGVISDDELDRRVAEEAELKASLASLTSALESARVALDATRIKAPFSGQVLEKRAELGAVLNPGQAVVSLFTPDALEVSVALEESEASLIPGLFAVLAGGSENVSDNTADIDVSVTARFAGTAHTWPATIARVAPTLSARTRTLEITVRIGRDEGAEDAVPALINAWATVIIAGQPGTPVLAVPSSQVRSGDSLWLVVEGQLRIIDISIVQVDKAISYVQLDQTRLDGPLQNARLVTSVLAAPVDGMSVRIVDSDAVPGARIEARALNQ